MDTALFWVGEWFVDPESDRVRRGDETVKIEPQTMRVLLLLARNAGAVVSQAEIERTVWADVVVTPSSVYQSIAQLRKALGDDGPRRQYIETVPRKGYRLIAPVTPCYGSDAVRQRSSAPERQRKRIVARWQLMAIAFAAVALGGAAVTLRASSVPAISNLLNSPTAQASAARELPLSVGALPVPRDVRPKLLRKMADVALLQGRPHESRAHLERALAIERAARGDKHPYVGETLVALAHTLVWMAEYDQAEALARSALATFSDTAELHPTRIDALDNLAYVLYETGKFDEARIHWQEALALTERIYGETSFTRARVLAALGALHLAQEDLEEAERMLLSAMDIAERMRIDEVQFAYYTSLLATTFIGQRRYDDARSRVDSALDRLRANVRADHPHIASLLEVRAKSFMGTGDHVRAEQDAREALRIWERNDFMKGRVASAASLLGETLLEQRRLAEAKAYLDRASLEIDDAPRGRREVLDLRAHRARVRTFELLSEGHDVSEDGESESARYHARR